MARAVPPSPAPLSESVSDTHLAPPNIFFDSEIVTLTSWLEAQQTKHAGATGAFTLLMQSLQTGTKVISNAVRRAGMRDLVGAYGQDNATGDAQQKLDVFSNRALVYSISHSGRAALLGSEEMDEAIVIPAKYSGPYIVTFDPLDGSSNIDCNVSIGTTFGIWKRKSPEQTEAHPDEILQSGQDLVAAGYCLYGSSTQFVIATRQEGVNCFTLEPGVGEFVLTHPNIRLAPEGKYFSINEGNTARWDKATHAFIAECKMNDAEHQPLSGRYVGTAVTDVHRTLMKGGIFIYPADRKNVHGKLRLLYEVAPLSFVIEMAGGVASTGTERCLDVIPEALHQRCPVYMGSRQLVHLAEELYATLGGGFP